MDKFKTRERSLVQGEGNGVQNGEHCSDDFVNEGVEDGIDDRVA